MSLTLTKLKKYAVFMRQGIALLLALLLLTGCAPAEPSESALHNFSGLLHQCSQQVNLLNLHILILGRQILGVLNGLQGFLGEFLRIHTAFNSLSQHQIQMIK